MKVTYTERTFIDKYKCIDRPVTRSFDTCWKVGGLTYFKLGQFWNVRKKQGGLIPC